MSNNLNNIYNLCTQKEINGEYYYRIPYTYIKTNKELSQHGGWTMILNSMLDIIEDAFEFKIYCYLCKNWNKDLRKAFPSISTISNECKISENKVKLSIKNLEKLGAIYKTRNKEKATSQWLHNSYEIYYFEKNENILYFTQMKQLTEDLKLLGKCPIFNDNGICIGITDLFDSNDLDLQSDTDDYEEF